MSLILPKYLQEREDYLNYTCDEFSKKLNAFIDEHDDFDEPYFILFKQNFDPLNPSIQNEVMSFYLQRPPLITGTMVFWVDNSRGLCFMLWSVTHQGKVKFNTKAASQLQEVLRAASV